MKIKLLFLLAAILLLIFLAFGCSGEANKGQPDISKPGNALVIQNFAFIPVNLNIAKGETVVWTNKDSVPHDVSGELFKRETLSSGETFSFTFKESGTFEYKCSLHPSMEGTITVK